MFMHETLLCLQCLLVFRVTYILSVFITVFCNLYFYYDFYIFYLLYLYFYRLDLYPVRLLLPRSF